MKCASVPSDGLNVWKTRRASRSEQRDNGAAAPTRASSARRCAGRTRRCAPSAAGRRRRSRTRAAPPASGALDHRVADPVDARRTRGWRPSGSTSVTKLLDRLLSRTRTVVRSPPGARAGPVPVVSASRNHHCIGERRVGHRQSFEQIAPLWRSAVAAEFATQANPGTDGDGAFRGTTTAAGLAQARRDETSPGARTPRARWREEKWRGRQVASAAATGMARGSRWGVWPRPSRIADASKRRVAQVQYPGHLVHLLACLSGRPPNPPTALPPPPNAIGRSEPSAQGPSASPPRATPRAIRHQRAGPPVGRAARIEATRTPSGAAHA